MQQYPIQYKKMLEPVACTALYNVMQRSLGKSCVSVANLSCYACIYSNKGCARMTATNFKVFLNIGPPPKNQTKPNQNQQINPCVQMTFQSLKIYIQVRLA